MLLRIPGLAERFVYLNDDFMLLRPVAREDFFRDDSVVLRGGWRGRPATPDRGSAVRTPGCAAAWRQPAQARRGGNHAAQQLSAPGRLPGDRYFQFPHCPAPLRRVTAGGLVRRSSRAARGQPCLPPALGRAVPDRGLANHLELAPAPRSSTTACDPAPAAGRELAAGAARGSWRRPTPIQRLAFCCVQSLDVASAGRSASWFWAGSMRRIGAGREDLLRRDHADDRRARSRW